MTKNENKTSFSFFESETALPAMYVMDLLVTDKCEAVKVKNDAGLVAYDQNMLNKKITTRKE